jgi:hypothetical protein
LPQRRKFHEFGIKVLLAKQGITRDQFTATWKLVSSQSERQLGAYYFLYLLQFKKPPLTAQRRVEFRNNVIHKGCIPTSTEVFDHAEYVYDYILNTLATMKSSLNSQISQVCTDDMEEMLKSCSVDVSTRSVAAPTMLWLLGPEEKFGKDSFRVALKKRKEKHRNELENRLSDFENEDDETA